ncbi:4-nitrophenylphosphatase [Thraustotheca clavata]|uniref:4-nitrophenylphosphatase n=1 Tax=Thraustotheca clavata TaxID=74557 RepID=A0A1V9ZVV8_9STRA|nr:4-nitrophenylphosphatase [Thraustotheca clavata]
MRSSLIAMEVSNAKNTVLWRGSAAIDGAKEAVAYLRSLGKKVVFVTNNSTKSRDTYVKKLVGQGIPASIDDIVTSASACAAFLRKNEVKGKVYVVGEAGLAAEVTAQGFENLGLEHNGITEVPQPFTVDPQIGAVVIGLDRAISYYKLSYAAVSILNNPGCKFYATNTDATFPVDGAILPGGGSCVAALATAVGRQPDAVIGKPSQVLLQTILSTHNLDPARTCMVGDRLNTDIEFGRLGGLKTLLVLTGITTQEEMEAIDNDDQRPDFYVESIDAINQLAK